MATNMHTPTKRQHREQHVAVTPTSSHGQAPTDDQRGQMAKLVDPELRDKLANSPRNIRYETAMGYKTRRTPLGQTRSEPLLGSSSPLSPVAQPIFESSRDTLLRTYLESPNTSPFKRGLQPMYETNSPSISNGTCDSPASQAYREKLRQEQMQSWTRLSLGTDVATRDDIVDMQLHRLPSMSIMASALDPLVFTQRANKRVSAMDNNDDGATEFQTESNQMPMDLDSRPKRGLPRQSIGGQQLSKTQSLPLFSMEEDF